MAFLYKKLIYYLKRKKKNLPVCRSVIFAERYITHLHTIYSYLNLKLTFVLIQNDILLTFDPLLIFLAVRNVERLLFVNSSSVANVNDSRVCSLYGKYVKPAIYLKLIEPGKRVSKQIPTSKCRLIAGSI